MQTDQYDFKSISSTLAFRRAEAENLTVVLPQPNQLFIDMDDEAGSTAFARNITKFKQHIAVVVEEDYSPSKSEGPYNYHYTLTLDKSVSPIERILYQLFLGSDRTREALSYIRLINNDPNPTLFLEAKPKMLTEGAQCRQ